MVSQEELEDARLSPSDKIGFEINSNNPSGPDAYVVEGFQFGYTADFGSGGEPNRRVMVQIKAGSMLKNAGRTDPDSFELEEFVFLLDEDDCAHLITGVNRQAMRALGPDFVMAMAAARVVDMMSAQAKAEFDKSAPPVSDAGPTGMYL